MLRFIFNTQTCTTPLTGTIRASINIRMIRHAESKNNQVYRDARFLFRGGTPDFDPQGWEDYVSQHRSSDPSLSDIGIRQRDRLAEYLVPHINNQASRNGVDVIVSPMMRTLETIRPTLEQISGARIQVQHSWIVPRIGWLPFEPGAGTWLVSTRYTGTLPELS